MKLESGSLSNIGCAHNRDTYVVVRSAPDHILRSARAQLISVADTCNPSYGSENIECAAMYLSPNRQHRLILSSRAQQHTADELDPFPS